MNAVSHPKSVYLDAANWFDLAEGNMPNEKFESAVKAGLVIPILSFIHILEIGKRDEPYRSQVTQYLDSVCALGPIRWIRGLPAVVKAEINNAFLASMGISVITVNPFADHLVDTLDVKLPWYDRNEARTFSIAKIVQDSASLESHTQYSALKHSYPVFDIPRLRALKKTNTTGNLVQSISEYAAEYLDERISTPTGITVPVTPETLKQFKVTFHQSDCPSFANKLAFFEGWSLSSGGEEPSIIEDLFHLVALSYCDEVFVDGGTWEALKKGKAMRQPRRNGDFKAWLMAFDEV